MKDLIKKQDEEFVDMLLSNPNSSDKKAYKMTMNFISKVRKETAEKVCDEMIMENPNTDIRAWQAIDRRRREQRKVKEQILKELL